MGQPSPQEVLARIVAEQRVEHLTYVADAVPDSLPVGRADNVYVFDAFGNQFLDLSAGYGVMVLGHHNEAITNPTALQLSRHAHTAPSGEHSSPIVSRYAKALSDTFPELDGASQQVLFCATPDEAMTQAMTLAQAATDRVYLETGKTLMDSPGPRNWKETAALILSFVGHTYDVLEQGWARMVAETAEADGCVVIADERRTGYGRTGSLWAHQQWGLDPAITVLGGAGGGGLPFGAIVASKTFFDCHKPSQRLFGASPTVCQAGIVVLDQLTPSLLEHVTDAGHILADGITELAGQFPDLIVTGTGIGLARGMVMTRTSVADWFVAEALSAGLLLRPPVAERIIPITPPLVISESEVRRAIDLMASVCLDWKGETL